MFAETPIGQEFLERIERLAIRGSAIQLIVRAQGRWSTTPYAGQTVVLWFNDHDDGYAGDPTYFLLDDVSLGS